jgi:hypothetical protein
MTVFVVMAAVGAALVAVGVGLWAYPAGIALGGVELVGAAYMGTYFRAKSTRAV